jgi:putative spermidine/putrescine transport system permease protein
LLINWGEEVNMSEITNPTIIQQRRTGEIVRMLLILGVVIMVILPMIPMLVWAFSSRWLFPLVVPREFSMRAWKYIVSPYSQVFKAFGNSLIIALIVTLFSIIIGIPAGRAFGLHKFKGKTFFQFLILAPSLIPGLTVTMGIHIVFIRNGLADTVTGVMLVHLLKTIPYMVISLTAVFANYDPQFEEQARILGAGYFRTFFIITIPAIMPGIITGGLFAFIISWSEYIMSVLIGGGRVITLPLLLFSYVGSGDNMVTGALCIVFLIPTIIILVFSSKYLTKNAAGASSFTAGM